MLEHVFGLAQLDAGLLDEGSACLGVVEVGQLVNELLKKDIELIEAAR